MPIEFKSNSDKNSPQIYQIKLKGQLDPGWTGWFNEMEITKSDEDITVLTGPVVDQSALHGLLKKVRDLGISLVSLYVIESCSQSENKLGNLHKPDLRDQSKKRSRKGSRHLKDY